VAARVRVAFLGNDPWSVPSLKALHGSADGLELALVVTRDARPGRRGAGTVPTLVADAARPLGIPVVETPSVRSGPGLDALRAARPEVLAVVAYGELLTADVLGVAALGAVNLHFSLLPRWRGAAPVQHALLAGDERTGVTTMLIDEGLDTGPILERVEEPILADDDAGSLGGRLASIGATLLVSSIEDLAAGRTRVHPQIGEVTLAPKIRAADRRLVWAETAGALIRRIRALAPEPGASTPFRGEGLKILRAEEETVTGEAGSIVRVDDAGFVIATAAGGLRPLVVVPHGRSRMPAADFARGARLRVGERLI
jgi:methionyl-tRNA formyltransferase